MCSSDLQAMSVVAAEATRPESQSSRPSARATTCQALCARPRAPASAASTIQSRRGVAVPIPSGSTRCSQRSRAGTDRRVRGSSRRAGPGPEDRRTDHRPFSARHHSRDRAGARAGKRRPRDSWNGRASPTKRCESHEGLVAQPLARRRARTDRDPLPSGKPEGGHPGPRRRRRTPCSLAAHRGRRWPWKIASLKRSTIPAHALFPPKAGITGVRR